MPSEHTRGVVCAHSWQAAKFEKIADGGVSVYGETLKTISKLRIVLISIHVSK
jgi:hypothetical protein